MRDRVFPGLAVVGGPPRRRLGRQPPRREEPPHRMGLGHRAEDPPRAGTAGTDEDLDRKHAAEQRGGRLIRGSREHPLPRIGPVRQLHVRRTSNPVAFLSFGSQEGPGMTL